MRFWTVWFPRVPLSGVRIRSGLSGPGLQLKKGANLSGPSRLGSRGLRKGSTGGSADATALENSGRVPGGVRQPSARGAGPPSPSPHPSPPCLAGQLNEDVTYEQFYSFLGCLQVSTQ